MDTVNDNPLKRFTTVVWGLALIGVFGVLVLLLGPWLNQDKKDAVSLAMGENRLAILKEVEDAQREAMKVDPEAVYAQVGKELLASKPVAVENAAHLVPGSPTWEKLQNSDEAVPDIEELPADTPLDPAVMELGKAQYVLCTACHGADGNGLPNLGPPLAGSEWVLGPVQNLIRIQLRGLTGPITVKGVEYNPPAPMAPMSYQTDEQLAAVLTYVRNSFGNKASPVTPEQVKALRGEAGKPFLTVDDLIPPGGSN